MLIPIEQDGQLRDFYWMNSISPIYEQDRIVGAFNVAQDTTEAVLAARDLRESEARASQILESIGDAVIVTDRNARITRLNAVAEALTGWPAMDAQGRQLTEVFRVVNERTRQPVQSPSEKIESAQTVVRLPEHSLLIARNGSRRASMTVARRSAMTKGG